MGGSSSTGAIVGIVFSCIGFLLIVGCCVFLRTVLNHRRRVRRAVADASAAAPPPAVRSLRSRYPEAIPCDDYDQLFPNEEPARGNVVFQSRADMDHMREVLVRIEDAGEDQSSEDFTTTEMVSVNNSFARARPAVHAGQAVQERLKPTPVMVPSKMGSFDNEHNVAMSFVSAYPTPASSMPAFAQRSRGGLASSSFNPGVGGSYAASFGAPPVARAESAALHFQDRSRGGLRLLVPVEDRSRFGDAPPRSREHSGVLEEDGDNEGDHPTPKKTFRTPVPEDTSGRGEFTTARSPLHSTSRPPMQREGNVTDAASFQERANANAASFSQHLAPSFQGWEGAPEHHRAPPPSALRPPALSVTAASYSAGGVGRSILLGPTRQDRPHLHHPPVVPTKKHKLRIHRQHRVRNVDKGGYVVLEETDSSSDQEADISNGEKESTQVALSEQQQGGGGEQTQSPSPPSSPTPAPGTTNAAGGAATATASAAAKAKDKKRRYYFEKRSSFDVYGRGQYMTGAAGGYPPMEQSSSGSEGEREEAGNTQSVHPLPIEYTNSSQFSANYNLKPE